MTAQLTPGATRMIVENLAQRVRAAEDDLRAAELRLKTANAALAEARQHYGLAA